MTYLILADLADRITFNGADAPGALETLRETRKLYPQAGIVEVIIGPDDTATKISIPAELDKAIDLWNEKIGGKGKLKFYKRTIEQRAIYVRPFKTWRKAIGTRDYFLWQLIDDILVANDFLQSFILFGHLFRQAKSKEWHSDLLRAGHYRDPKRRAPEPPPKPMSEQDKRDEVKWLREHKESGLGSMSVIRLEQYERDGY